MKISICGKYQNRGITLIALVITIIVLLILAGVTINLTLGENGIFKTAQQAAENYTNTQAKEIESLEEFNNTLNNIIKENDEQEFTDVNPLVPNMTSNISPSGIASASYQNQSYYAWCAFSSDETDSWSAWPYGQGNWIMYQFEQPVRIKKLEIQAWDVYSVIQNFKVYGSNDGDQFDIIFEGTHGKNTDLETYELPNYSKPYTYLKLYADSVWDNAALRIKKLQYYGIQ